MRRVHQNCSKECLPTPAHTRERKSRALDGASRNSSRTLSVDVIGYPSLFRRWVATTSGRTRQSIGRFSGLSLGGEHANTGPIEQVLPRGGRSPNHEPCHAVPHQRQICRPWPDASTAVVIGSLILALASEQLDLPGLRAFLIGWIVIPYVVSGMVAWWRRPASRLGPLMVATGFGMAITPLQWSDQPLVYSVGHLFDMLPAALFLHVFLAFPTGRLTARPEQVVVVACYVTVLGLQLLKVIFGVNPDSVFVVIDQPEIGNVVEQVQLVLVCVFLLAGAVLLYLRQRRAGQSHRRPAALVVDAFGLALVMLAILYAAGLGAWPAAETIRLVTFASLGLAPIAFLFALLDARLARSEVANLLVELRRNPTADPQEPLARVLRDPWLRLAYWLPKSRSWADQNGQPMALPEADERRAVRVIHRDNEPMAAMVFDRTLEDEHELLDAIAAAAGIALENGRLRAELGARH